MKRPRRAFGLVAIVAVCALAFFVSCSKPTEPTETEPTETGQASEPTVAEALAKVEAAIEVAETTSGNGEPAMWLLQDEDTTIHIFGSIHLLKSETEWRSGKIDKAFADSDKLVMEVDAVSPEAQAQMGAMVLSKGAFTDGTKISDLLSEEEVEAVKASLAEINMQLAAVDAFKPWFATLFVSNSQMVNAGYNPESGVETVLAAEATSRGMSFGYLETLEDQISIFADEPLEDQLKAFVFAAETASVGPKALDVLAAEWADGDTAGLTAMVGNPNAFEEQADYEALLVNRNRNWVPQIKAMLDEPGTVFIAVGAGHLVGDDSVIAMLRDEGLTVTKQN